MILRRFVLGLALAALAGASLAAPKRAQKAPDPDQAIVAAQAAFAAGDALKLARHSAGLENHLLAPWLEYWRMKLRLEETPDAEVEAFLERHAGSHLAERLRADWLTELGRRAEWDAFERAAPLLVQDDLEIRCYAWSARLARGDSGAYAEARALWLEPRELPESCATLAAAMAGAGEADAELLWQRVRLLAQNGHLAAARRALAFLPADEAVDERLFAQAATAPARVLASPPRRLERRATREMVLLAVLRLARGDRPAAAEVLRGPLGARLPAADLAYLWGRLGYEAARRLEPEGLDWFRRAGDVPMQDEQLEWKARAGLRAEDWQAVRDAIDAMSATARREQAWSYWYGRALGAQGNAEGARAYFLRISGEPSFYGLLAAEELGYIPAAPTPFHEPGEEEVAAARSDVRLQRSLELYRLGLRLEATREWRFAMRGMDDARLLAAAELARRAGVFDRAINTASQTEQRHNFRLRFPAPFREVFSEHARLHELEEAWVLGLVRQESRFIADAKSPAGARGLMQLMPRTASWMARKAGLRDYHPSRVGEVRTNVALGTGYLKLVLADLGHPVLACAAYNAGPGRARRWRDARPLEGAVYAETIPFNETRDYVKRVMSNTMYYALLSGGPVMPLKERLGVIPARAAGERFNGELP